MTNPQTGDIQMIIQVIALKDSDTGTEFPVNQIRFAKSVIDSVGSENKIRCIKILRAALCFFEQPDSGLKYAKDLFEIVDRNKYELDQYLYEVE